MSVALFTAVVALVAGLISSAVTGWLAGRAKVSEELRELRLSVYPPVWKRTSVVSRYPTTDATYADLEQLHLDLRRWYYGLGGVALSRNARDRFMDLQKLIGTHLARDGGPPDARLEPDTYAGVMELASAFRKGITDDLESRRQRALWWTIGRERDHRRLRRKAGRLQTAAEAERLDDHGRPRARRDVRHELTQEERLLEEPAPPPA